MTYLKDAYSKFRANPRHAPVAANVSLIYVPSTTRIDGADAVASHTSRQSAHLRKKSEKIISEIESSDSLCLDIETTIEFLEGGGAYLPSFDDNFLADRVVTFPTLHIVQFNPENQIQQVRIYWDQGSLLKELEVIGARGRNWPIRQAQEQTRLLKAAAIAKDAAPSLEPSQGDLPARPSSPGKRHIRDPYSAASLTDLLSPNKDGAVEQELETRRPPSPSKRHTRDPYGQGSLTEILSPSKPETNTVMRPYGGSNQPARRDLGDIFVADDGETPSTPSKAEKVISPKGGSRHQVGNRLFGGAEDHDEHRSFYKSDPRKYDHFEIGANEGRPEDRSFYKSDPRKYDHFELGASETPRGEEGLQAKQTPPEASDTQTRKLIPTPPPHREAVVKARPDQSAHFEISDDVKEEDGRIISSFGNRGKGLYENRLYDEDEAAAKSHEGEREEALGVTSNKANLNKTFNSQWEMHDNSPGHKATPENPKTLAADRSKAVKALEAHWDYSDSPQPTRTATSLHNPKTHNQPSWNMQDEASPIKPATSLRNPRTHNQPSWSMGGEE
ncbi:hypothetical protein N7533_001689 [Penicillium manginii]|uniref:uncharacterized protein n=1 Tax=Penicillium manginii TaxID=203109 RepID=UPI00254967AC|nr:uncharacterized protein N7533_001689 [Penicillium manginii]KAJ5763008.1 hypothetical protein N7533_001689 [Penicillium manginii]